MRVDEPSTCTALLALNPIVYFLLTDRFHAAGRIASPAAQDVGTFHGGNFLGVTEKIKDGWFSALGVNALWISAPYEQILGPGVATAFQHYAYHGYWPLDFTVPEARFGTREELHALVDAAHAAGIRIVLDVVMSHPGYIDLPSLRKACGDSADGDAALLTRWWGADWVRTDGCTAPGTALAPGHGLAHFRTESDAAVALPSFLLHKAGSGAVARPDTSVRGYLIGWLSDWVRKYGIDGFRCDSAQHVDLRSWRELKHACVAALAEWKENHPDQRIDDAPFWMTGEVFGNGIVRNAYHDNGFDSLINFQFQRDVATMFGDADMDDDYPRSLALHRLDLLYASYAAALAGPGAHQVLSYISSHDTALCDQQRHPYASVALMLVPGGVQIFYGDECGRMPGPCTPEDPTQATRSDMNWNTPDLPRLGHWRRLGQFRNRHPAISCGRHRKLSDDPYVFCRTDAQGGDAVIIAIGYAGILDLVVGEVFPGAVQLYDAYAHRSYTVHDGRVQISIDGILLLERA